MVNFSLYLPFRGRLKIFENSVDRKLSLGITKPISKFFNATIQRKGQGMLQERIEGKWLAAFRRVFALNGIGKGTKLAIIHETQSRPVLIQLCELAKPNC